MSSTYMNTHVHSQFSTIDGMNRVPDLVARAAKYKQPGLALTDHGNGAGWVQLYNSCKKHGLLPFPGVEAYIVDPKYDLSALGTPELDGASRYHLIIMALDLKGYQGLVRLITKSFSRPRFHKFPRLLIDDLVEFGAEYGNHVAVTTGCYFGLVQRTYWENGWDATAGVVRQLQASFPHLFVELHNHSIPDGYNEMGEVELTDMLLKVSQDFSLPLLAGADSHYLEQSQKSAHALMKRMVYGGAEDEFPGDTYHLPSTGWMEEKFNPHVWKSIEQSCGELVELNKLSIPQLDKFQVHVPKMSDTPDEELQKVSLAALYNLGVKDEDLPEYEARMKHELEVIKITKTADYFLLVLQIVEHVKSLRIAIEARGSVNGSLLCYALGITQIDPIKFDTSFERFMAIDRIEPPDIDIDIADDKRHIVLEYLNNLTINGMKYKTSQIGTFGKFGQSENDDNDTGSAFNQYFGSLRREFEEQVWQHEKELAEQEGRKPVKRRADEIADENWKESPLSKIKKLEDVKRYRPADYEGLKEIIKMNSVYKSKGTHAGGILISSEETKIEDFVPLMFIPKDKTGTWVTQYTMNDLKYLGLLKMDWLGQTSLTVMSKCMEFLGRDPLDFTWIPFDDEQVIKYTHSRKSHIGLFHLEQYPKSVAMSELKPENTMDFVVWQAYSMPGAADSGAKDIYLKRRKAKNFKPDYSHPILHRVFDQTLGVMLYQDQVLNVCRGIGMDGAELTNFFTIVKDSGSGAVERNRIRLNEEKPRFVELATNAGLTEKEIEWVWHQIVAMGGYAFGKGHSAGYGVRSYRTAYLKYYYPVEYMAALLYCWAGKNTLHNKRAKIKKDEAYLREAKNMNLRILPVRVNKSLANWSVDKNRNALRKGYLSVKGIGPAVAPRIEAFQPYADIKDFCERAKPSGAKPYLECLAKERPVSYTGVLGTLKDIDALEYLGTQ